MLMFSSLFKFFTWHVALFQYFGSWSLGGGAVVTAFASQQEGRGFDSWPGTLLCGSFSLCLRGFPPQSKNVYVSARGCLPWFVSM